MKVCILTTSFPAYKGHFQSPFILNLANSLVKHNIKVHVVCPFYKDSKKKYEVWNGIKIHRFQYFYPKFLQKLTSGGGIPSNLNSSFISKIQFPFFILSMFLRARKIVKKCDIIHAQWALSAFVGIFLKKIYKKSIILTESGASANIAVKGTLLKRVLMWTLKNCNFITANNEDQIKLFKRLGIKKDKLKAVFNGIDTVKFKPRNKDLTKSKLNLPKNKRIILFVGWLIKRKGCKYLISSLNRLRKKYPNLILLIVGEGNLSFKLKQQVIRYNLEEQVYFIGPKTPQEIPSYMNAADIFVLPSLSEGRPNVVGESMAAGTPTIATAVNGTSEFIEDGKDGFLIRPKEVGELTKALDTLLRNKELSNKFSINSRKSIIRKKLNWDSCAKNYIKIYTKLIR